MRSLVIAIALACVGCQETQHCDPYRAYQNGECRPTGDAALVPDDAAADASIDGSSGGCTTDRDCNSLANDAGLVCVQSHCVVGCGQDSDCASGHCTMMRTCSMYGRHQTTCQPCDSDEDCSQLDGASNCVDTQFQHTTDGGHCLLRTNATCSQQPYTTLVTRTSVDGVMTQYCAIDETTTTCAAILSATLQTHCASPTDCAMRGADCQIVVAGGTMQCTIDCARNDQCPMGFGCAPQTFCHM